ncbi:MAG: hypothetical protein CFE23_11000 [Flavobacterium sp. BFFFF1]|uniref:hypothetical protein n=1 Tax=Flavobacterium sp. BFFFF1 TaxID=2015557 RepID=UPI000BCEB9C2|nr:hypothetical protein [Flavobacterium sp. BFFFF1]OYU80063.1 MAG: hypothetical protein CFE23_11000 [Flavobacterium sp. BFFFF1]
MKNKLLLMAAACGLMMSCSSSDESNGTTNTYFLPLTTGNYWVYDVSGSQNLAGRDSLYIEKDTIINAKTYSKFKTEVTPTGFFSTTLNGNAVRKENGKLYLTGSAGLNFGNALPVNLDVTDFVVLDENASPNQQLGVLNGSLSQDFQGIPLTITYNLKATAGENLASYSTPNGTAYNNVKKVVTVLNLSINATFGGFPIAILPTQDVVTSTQYYAEGIGMVYASTNITYTLNDLSLLQIQLPIPQSDSQNQKEELDNYNIL